MTDKKDDGKIVFLNVQSLFLSLKNMVMKKGYFLIYKYGDVEGR